MPLCMKHPLCLGFVALLTAQTMPNTAWAQRLQTAPPISGVIGKVQSVTGSALDVQPLTTGQVKEQPVEHPTSYRKIQIDGLSIFYREAGPKDAPTILLLHGLPSSSRMFEALLTRLSNRYHLVAPDYPGFGHSDWPDSRKFAYTFDHIAAVM